MSKINGKEIEKLVNGEFSDYGKSYIMNKINEILDALDENNKPNYILPNTMPVAIHKHESDGLQYLSNPPQYKCKQCGAFYYINH